jgi:hypothetical protein
MPQSSGLNRARHADQNGIVESFNGRVRDDLLSETLFLTIRQARSIFARVHDYNTERSPASLGYATPAAFVYELKKKRAGFNPPATTPVHLWLRLDERRGSRHFIRCDAIGTSHSRR